MSNKNAIPSTQEDFSAGLEAILSRELTPSTIDNYAEDALTDLIELTDRAVASYDSDGDRQTREDEAFTYFGLGSIGGILDRVQGIAEGIHDLDDVLKHHVEHTNIVITPSDSGKTLQIGSGDGMLPKKLEQRLKTVLFILREDFGLDVRNHDQVRIQDGIRPKDMVRSESYNAVEVRSLNRVLFVCDEVGNATFVFDTAKLAELGIAIKILAKQTKLERKQLILAHPIVGRTITGSGQYVQQVITALKEPISQTDSFVLSEPANYLRREQILYEKPEGWATAKDIAEELGVPVTKIDNVITVLRRTGVLGQAEKIHNPGAPVANIFDADAKQQIIERALTGKRGVPEGFVTVSGLAARLRRDGLPSVRPNTLHAMIDRLGEEVLGTLERSLVPSRHGILPIILSAKQQEILEASYRGARQIDGALSASSMIEKFDSHEITMNRLLSNLEKEGKLDPPMQKMVGSRMRRVYSKNDQAVVEAALAALPGRLRSKGMLKE